MTAMLASVNCLAEALVALEAGSDIAYLHTGFEKTAGAREYEAWDKLMAVIDLHKKELKS
jgi:hypothetical protein